MKRAVRVAALSLASALLTVAVLVVADRYIVGRVLPEPPLIFPAHDAFRYHTIEFSAVAHANAMGFRDREFSAPPLPGVTRVLAIGDSFTYGWGVRDDEPWPKVLERRLVAAGERVEIANIGMPGADPADYEDLAVGGMARLHPALTIVAVVQGDDLAQMAAVTDAEEPRVPRWKRIVHRLIPHLLELRNRWRDAGDAGAAQPVWKAQAAEELATYDPARRARFAGLGDDVREAFLSGNLNPALMQYVVDQPGRLAEVDDPDAAKTRSAIARMSGHLAAIRRVASANRSDLLVVSVPFGPYASARDYRNAEHVGFKLLPDMPVSAHADDAIRRASEQAGVPFVSVMSEFRKEAASRQLFFALDGHLTRAGHEVVAALVAPAVASRLSGSRHAVR